MTPTLPPPGPGALPPPGPDTLPPPGPGALPAPTAGSLPAASELGAPQVASQQLIIRVAVDPPTGDLDNLAVVIHRPEGDVSCTVDTLASTTSADAPPVGSLATCVLTPAWVADLEISGEVRGTTQSLYQRIVRLDDLHGMTLSYVIDVSGAQPVVERTAWSHFDSPTDVKGTQVALLGGFGWGLLCAVYVCFLALSRKRPR